jgi:ABC-type nickel/cobalt efflux system permease component RcnA
MHIPITRKGIVFMATNTGRKFTPLTMGLAMIAGLGLILMVIALSIGVIEGANADSTIVGLVFAGGLGLMVVGIGAWFAVVQPQKHFDNIEVPMYSGHHEEHHEPAAEDHGSDDSHKHASPSAH